MAAIPSPSTFSSRPHAHASSFRTPRNSRDDVRARRVSAVEEWLRDVKSGALERYPLPTEGAAEEVKRSRDIHSDSPMLLAQGSPPPRPRRQASASPKVRRLFSPPTSPPTHPNVRKSSALCPATDSLPSPALSSKSSRKKRKAAANPPVRGVQRKRARVEVLLERQLFKSRLLVDSLWRMQQERGDLRARVEEKEGACEEIRAELEQKQADFENLNEKFRPEVEALKEFYQEQVSGRDKIIKDLKSKLKTKLQQHGANNRAQRHPTSPQTQARNGHEQKSDTSQQSPVIAPVPAPAPANLPDSTPSNSAAAGGCDSTHQNPKTKPTSNQNPRSTAPTSNQKLRSTVAVVPNFPQSPESSAVSSTASTPSQHTNSIIRGGVAPPGNGHSPGSLLFSLPFSNPVSSSSQPTPPSPSRALLDVQMAQLRKQRDAAESTAKTVEALLESERNQYKLLENDLRKAREENEALTAENAKLCKANAEAEARCGALEASVSSAQAAVKTLEEERSALEKKAEEFRGVKLAATGGVRARIKTLAEENSTLEKKVNELEKSRFDAHATMKALAKEKSSLEKKVASLSAENARLCAKVTEMTHECFEFVAEAKKMQSDFESDKGALERQVEALEARGNRLSSEMEAEQHKSANKNCTPILKQASRIRKLELEVERYRKMAETQRALVVRMSAKNKKVKAPEASRSSEELSRGDCDTSECSSSDSDGSPLSDSDLDRNNGNVGGVATRSRKRSKLPPRPTRSSRRAASTGIGAASSSSRPAAQQQKQQPQSASSSSSSSHAASSSSRTTQIPAQQPQLSSDTRPRKVVRKSPKPPGGPSSRDTLSNSNACQSADPPAITPIPQGARKVVRKTGSEGDSESRESSGSSNDHRNGENSLSLLEAPPGDAEPEPPSADEAVAASRSVVSRPKHKPRRGRPRKSARTQKKARRGRPRKHPAPHSADADERASPKRRRFVSPPDSNDFSFETPSAGTSVASPAGKSVASPAARKSAASAAGKSPASPAGKSVCSPAGRSAASSALVVQHGSRPSSQPGRIRSSSSSSDYVTSSSSASARRSSHGLRPREAAVSKDQASEPHFHIEVVDLSAGSNMPVDQAVESNMPVDQLAGSNMCDDDDTPSALSESPSRGEESESQSPIAVKDEPLLAQSSSSSSSRSSRDEALRVQNSSSSSNSNKIASRHQSSSSSSSSSSSKVRASNDQNSSSSSNSNERASHHKSSTRSSSSSKVRASNDQNSSSSSGSSSHLAVPHSHADCESPLPRAIQSEESEVVTTQASSVSTATPPPAYVYSYANRHLYSRSRSSSDKTPPDTENANDSAELAEHKHDTPERSNSGACLDVPSPASDAPSYTSAVEDGEDEDGDLTDVPIDLAPRGFLRTPRSRHEDGSDRTESPIGLDLDIGVDRPRSRLAPVFTTPTPSYKSGDTRAPNTPDTPHPPGSSPPYRSDVSSSDDEGDNGGGDGDGDGEPVEEVSARTLSAKRTARKSSATRSPKKSTKQCHERVLSVDDRDNSQNSKPNSQDEQYEVEYIIAHRVDKARSKRGLKKYMFKVHWVGYSSSEDTWEPEDNLRNCRDLVDEFIKSLKSLK